MASQCGRFSSTFAWVCFDGANTLWWSGVSYCFFVFLRRSPRLDACGNSVRAVQVAKELGKRFLFHNFEVLSGLSVTKMEPTEQKNEAKHNALGAVLFAASHGDIKALISQLNAGINLYEGDYDARTALHLAAAERHPHVVRFLIENAPSVDALSPRDRWGGTPLDDAQACYECSKLLLDAGAKKGTTVAPDVPSNSSSSLVRQISVSDQSFSANLSPDAPNILFPAFEGDVNELIKMRARGEDLFCQDYDLRAAMHLAASEGHLHVLIYLAAQARHEGNLRAALHVMDRWRNTPLDDAKRENHKSCEAFLRSVQ